MLKDHFFTITALASENNTATVSIDINEKHKIFDGHFPGQPVVPGVCLLQMVKEVTEVVLSKKLLLIKAEELKFLMIINPTVNKTLVMLLNHTSADHGKLNVTASLLKERSVCFKFKGQFNLSV